MEKFDRDAVNVLALPKESVNDILDEIREKNYDHGYVMGYGSGVVKGSASGFIKGTVFTGTVIVGGLVLGLLGKLAVDKIFEVLDEEKEELENGPEPVQGE